MPKRALGACAVLSYAVLVEGFSSTLTTTRSCTTLRSSCSSSGNTNWQTWLKQQHHQTAVKRMGRRQSTQQGRGLSLSGLCGRGGGTGVAMAAKSAEEEEEEKAEMEELEQLRQSTLSAWKTMAKSGQLEEGKIRRQLEEEATMDALMEEEMARIGGKSSRRSLIKEKLQEGEGRGQTQLSDDDLLFGGDEDDEDFNAFFQQGLQRQQQGWLGSGGQGGGRSRKKGEEEEELERRRLEASLPDWRGVFTTVRSRRERDRARANPRAAAGMPIIKASQETQQLKAEQAAEAARVAKQAKKKAKKATQGDSEASRMLKEMGMQIAMPLEEVADDDILLDPQVDPFAEYDDDELIWDEQEWPEDEEEDEDREEKEGGEEEEDEEWEWDYDDEKEEPHKDDASTLSTPVAFSDPYAEEDENFYSLFSFKEPASLRGWLKAIRDADADERDARLVHAIARKAAGVAESKGLARDELYIEAMRIVARLGRLDLALEVEKLRMRLLKKTVLQGYDMTMTVGLAVACLRNNQPADVDMLLEQTGRSVGEKGVFAILSAVLPEKLDLLLKSQAEAAAAVGGSKEASRGPARWETEGRPAIKDKGKRREGKRTGEQKPLSTAELAIVAQVDGVVEELFALGSKAVGPKAVKLDASCYNAFIRLLGKAARLDDVMRVLDHMKDDCGIMPNMETYEFLTNAFVKDVQFDVQSISMATLPKTSLPEVVFAGRSNVGKSSLVNMMVNRKTLAPMSDRPGFTQHFNYYIVNKDRPDMPSFYLVDVPGLGYAEAAVGRIDSWRNTLQRYIAVRENLTAIFHLIDVRTGPQPTDRDLMEMVKEYKLEGSKYFVVLTKCDKVKDSQIEKVLQEVAEVLPHFSLSDDEGAGDNSQSDAAAAAAAVGGGEGDRQSQIEGVKVMLSSSKSRLGRDDLWKALMTAVL